MGKFKNKNETFYIWTKQNGNLDNNKVKKDLLFINFIEINAKWNIKMSETDQNKKIQEVSFWCHVVAPLNITFFSAIILVQINDLSRNALYQIYDEIK